MHRDSSAARPVPEIGDRIVLTRDVMTPDGDVLAMGLIVHVVGHRGKDPVIVDNEDHYAVVRDWRRLDTGRTTGVR